MTVTLRWCTHEDALLSVMNPSCEVCRFITSVESRSLYPYHIHHLWIRQREVWRDFEVTCVTPRPVRRKKKHCERKIDGGKRKRCYWLTSPRGYNSELMPSRTSEHATVTLSATRCWVSAAIPSSRLSRKVCELTKPATAPKKKVS